MPSQIVGILALIAALAIPFLIAYLQSEKVHIDPLYVAYSVPLLTMIAGACRSYLSRFSGTGTGLWVGADTKALAKNAGRIAALAMQIVGINGTSSEHVTAAVNSAVLGAADLHAPEAAQSLSGQSLSGQSLSGSSIPDQDYNTPLAPPPGNEPGETTGQFMATQSGLIEVQTDLPQAEAPAPAPVAV